MTQHTPGPWTVHINYASANYTVFDADGNYGETDGDTLTANAALIAAAPELLDLAYDFGQMLTNMDPYTVDDVAIMRNKIKAAIARATGAAQ